MRYCKKCVQPDTRPSIVFDEAGVCPPCRFAAENEKIDWAARRRELEKIAAFGREHNVFGYDCIVGVSGGKDSLRQSLFVRDELGLKPLLVSCTYPPEQLTERGAANLANLISLGFDCISVSPDPQVSKKLMRQSFLKYGNLCKAAEMALYASAPKIAIAYHIPLVVLGENDAIAFGSMDVGSVTGDANGMKNCHTLEGGNPDKLLTAEITEQDVFLYRYPSDEEMEWAKLKIIFLGYYIKDFTRFKNAELAIERGLTIRQDPPEDIGDAYGFEALDDDFVAVNQMLKYLKFGFGKVTDQVSEAVRFKLMDRPAAIELVKKYDGKCADRFVKRFCNYIGITEDKFWEVAEAYRDKDIWEKGQDGNFKLKVSLA
ncbi:MAG: N-acetyl sugar amidotransferase [Patescibacteria group bacterium]|nr:N-acetyl sugar amidotransferase [Patescibacteria group bacterium]